MVYFICVEDMKSITNFFAMIIVQLLIHYMAFLIREEKILYSCKK